MTNTDSPARPSYESDSKRLLARIAILEATPQRPERDALIAHLKKCLARLDAVHVPAGANEPVGYVRCLPSGAVHPEGSCGEGR